MEIKYIFNYFSIACLYWFLFGLESDGVKMKCVTIKKSGRFYNTFNDDAIIIGYLTGYRLIKGRCGFPLNNLNKITKLLEDNSISYVVKEGRREVNKVNYKRKNKYNKILDKSKKKYEIEYRISDIFDKVNSLSYDRLSELLDLIEKNCDEYLDGI